MNRYTYSFYGWFSHTVTVEAENEEIAYSLADDIYCETAPDEFNWECDEQELVDVQTIPEPAPPEPVLNIASADLSKLLGG